MQKQKEFAKTLNSKKVPEKERKQDWIESCAHINVLTFENSSFFSFSKAFSSEHGLLEVKQCQLKQRHTYPVVISESLAHSLKYIHNLTLHAHLLHHNLPQSRARGTSKHTCPQFWKYEGQLGTTGTEEDGQLEV